MKKYLMKCGHVSNAMTGDKRPVCAICDCDKSLHEVEGNEGLEGRMAICTGHNPKYGQAVPVLSKWTLPFFEYRPDCEYDLYYCGCYGWD